MGSNTPLEWTNKIARYPTTIEIAFLMLNSLTIHITCIRLRRIKTDITCYAWKACCWICVAPPYIWNDDLRGGVIKIALPSLPLAEGRSLILKQGFGIHIVSWGIVCRGSERFPMFWKSTDFLLRGQNRRQSIKGRQRLTYRWSRAVPDVFLHQTQQSFSPGLITD